MFRERMPPIVSRGKSHSPTPARILTEPLAKHFKTTQPPQCGVHMYTFAIWWRHCVFFDGNNGTSLDCLSWVNCFAISPIASCKKQILPRDIIARWWWYSVRHQLTAAGRVVRVFFSVFSGKLCFATVDCGQSRARFKRVSPLFYKPTIRCM